MVRMRNQRRVGREILVNRRRAGPSGDKAIIVYFFMLNLCHQPRFPTDNDNIFFCTAGKKQLPSFPVLLPPPPPPMPGESPKRIKWRFSTQGPDSGATRLILSLSFSLSLSALQIELLLWPLASRPLIIDRQRKIPCPDVGNENWLHSLFVSTLD